MLFRFLLIAGLILYVIYKIASFFFRAGAASQQQFRNPQRPDGNIHSGMNGKQAQKKGHFKDGEYIDYEEIK